MIFSAVGVRISKSFASPEMPELGEDAVADPTHPQNCEGVLDLVRDVQLQPQGVLPKINGGPYPASPEKISKMGYVGCPPNSPPTSVSLTKKT